MIPKSKKILFLFEGINSFAAVFYSNYLFFYMKQTFNFGDFENLLLAALNGFVYIFAAWQGGKFAQKNGNIKSIIIGTAGVIAALIIGFTFNTAGAQIGAFILWTISVCLIWPALEAVVSEGSSQKLSSMVGIYNMIWAGAAALAYFITGFIIERIGIKSIFLFPLFLHIIQITILLPLSVYHLKKEKLTTEYDAPAVEKVKPSYSDKFLHMAWIANPFSYIAISTVIPLIPSISSKMGLSTASAGFVCSIWMFARLGAFLTLWKWNGWHYRFRWLAGSFIVMVSSYTGMLLAESLFILILSQIAFGISIGIIYYSSLYYSMHASDEKGANGGLHEAMIGGGLFVGPAFGAACIYLVPAFSYSSGLPVNALLVAGFISIAWMGRFRFTAGKKNKQCE